MSRLYEEDDLDSKAFTSLQVDDVLEDEEELARLYRKKYADKYRLLRKIEKQQIEELRAERAQNSRFSTLIHRAASIAEKKLLEVVETEKFLDGTKVMCVFYIKVSDTPVATLEIKDYEKWELDYEATELAKKICKIIRGKK
jgi:hypothetical protein